MWWICICISIYMYIYIYVYVLVSLERWDKICCTCVLLVLAVQDKQEIKRKGFVLPTCTQKSIKPPMYTLFCKNHQDKIWKANKCKVDFRSKTTKKKSKKETQPPTIGSSAITREKEREKDYCKQARNTKQKPFLSFPLKELSANTHITHSKSEIMSK